MLLIPEKTAVFYDLEVTDVAIAKTKGTVPELLEVGAVKVTAELETVEEFSALVRPETLSNISVFTTELTGLTQHDVRDEKTWSAQWQNFAKFTGYKNCRLISWSAWQDMNWLKAAYARAGVSFPHYPGTMCAMSFCYFAAGSWGLKPKSHSLKSWCEYFGIEAEKQHRALTGAQKALEVLREMSQFL